MLVSYSSGKGSGFIAKYVSGLIIVAFVLAGIAFAEFAGPSLAASKRTEAFANVVDVRRYPRSNPPRLWVQFEFLDHRNRRVVSARAVRVKSFNDVSVGHRIKISYRKRYPKGARIEQLRPLSGPAKRTFSSFDYLRRFMLNNAFSLLIFGIVLSVVIRAIRRAARRLASLQRTTPIESVPVSKPASSGSRDKRKPERRTKTKVVIAKREGNAKQRAGWF